MPTTNLLEGMTQFHAKVLMIIRDKNESEEVKIFKGFSISERNLFSLSRENWMRPF